MNLRLLLLGLLLPLPLIAGPTFNYESAVSWANETVITKTQIKRKVYVFGPEKVTETYILNNQPAKHDVSVRRILKCHSGMTLGLLLKEIPAPPSDDFVVNIYRGSKAPVVSLGYRKALRSTFALKPEDAIDIRVVKAGFRH